MTNKSLLLLLCIPAMVMITACGKKSEDQPAVVNTAAVSTTPAPSSCSQPGYVYNPTYGCAPAQYGTPPNGYGGIQPIPVQPPASSYCNGNGYNGSNCWSNGYSWSYHRGVYYYWHT